jgi:hypothetical protein
VRATLSGSRGHGAAYTPPDPPHDPPPPPPPPPPPRPFSTPSNTVQPYRAPKPREFLNPAASRRSLLSLSHGGANLPQWPPRFRLADICVKVCTSATSNLLAPYIPLFALTCRANTRSIVRTSLEDEFAPTLPPFPFVFPFLFPFQFSFLIPSHGEHERVLSIFPSPAAPSFTPSFTLPSFSFFLSFPF